MERINFKNRSSNNTNWRKISVQSTSEDGKEIIAEITRCDNNVTEEGTHIDATTMNTFQDNIQREFDTFRTGFNDLKELVQTGGTAININGEFQNSISLDNDPQTQINNKANFDASNLTNDNIESWQNKLNQFLTTETITSLDGKIGTKNHNGQAVVVESYISSDKLTWYRIWSDGWKECGSYIAGTLSGAQTKTVQFPLLFINSPMVIKQSGCDGKYSNPVSWDYLQVWNITVESFVTEIYATTSGGAFKYYACGY